jgi:capsid assembly protease
MTRVHMQRYERTGLLAVDPRAFFELFAMPSVRETAVIDGVAVIEINGPLAQRDEMWTDSYEAIRARVQVALAEPSARAVVLRIDSPGGDASGCFETARAIRADAQAAGKPLYTYIDRACSAAYGLASAASFVAIGETCCAGSIGVMATRPDCSTANMMRGLRMAFVSSGPRKLDGNPDVPVSEAELAETQRHVDELAAVFFGLVSEHRPLTVEDVAALDGGIFYGASAVDAGLADELMVFDELLARASTGGVDMNTVQNKAQLSAKTDFDLARGALAKLAKGKDANAAAAKRALAALGAEGEPETPPPPDEPDEDEDETPAAAEDEEKDDPAAAVDGTPPAAVSGAAEAPAAEAVDGKAASVGASSTDVLALAAKVQRLEARDAAARESRTRRKLFAQRPDFSPEVVAVLKNAPIATLREAVEKLPRGRVAGKRPEPITTVPAARGHDQVDAPQSGRTRYSADADLLDRVMGFTSAKLGSKREGSTMSFGFVVDGERESASEGKA